MQYIVVGLGGALGSIVRFSLGKAISSKSSMVFPIATFIINITGAVLLGLVSSIGVGGNLYLLMADGFLGAYTTFSTFMYEGFTLIKDKQSLNALVYVLSSLLLGVVGFALGSLVGTAFR